MKELEKIHQNTPFTENYLSNAGIPIPKSFESSKDYLKALEEWVWDATNILAERNKQKRGYESSGY